MERVEREGVSLEGITITDQQRFEGFNRITTKILYLHRVCIEDSLFSALFSIFVSIVMKFLMIKGLGCM